MATNRLNALLQHLLRSVAPASPGEVSDAQLLDRFVLQRDEAAFELLLWRHGPMVLGLCQRLLHHEQDVEDAFQATFLVLVRKARSISKRQALASWLYKVAYRIACRARPRVPVHSPRSQAELGNEPRLDDWPAPEAPDDVSRRDLRALLDEEVARLPETYRRAIVLSYLQGKTNEEAARLLGWPKGTVATRLTRARERLRLRLERRGLAVTSVALASALTDKALAGVMPAELVRGALTGALAYAAGSATAATILSAKTVALTEGVLRIMWYSKMKVLASVLLAVTLTSAGIGLAVRQVWAASGPDEALAAPADPVPVNALVKKKGASQADVTKLREEIDRLRAELDFAVQEIRQLKAALRLPTAPPEQGPLYRGRPASVWLEQLKDADAKYRAEAVTALGALAENNKTLIPVLGGVLKDKSALVSSLAVGAVEPFAPEVVSLVVQLLKDKSSPSARARAAEVLGRIGPAAKAAIPVLTQAVKDEDVKVRRAAIDALAEMKADAKMAVPNLAQVLKHHPMAPDDYDVHRSTIAALRAIGPDAKPAIPALVEVMGEYLQEYKKREMEIGWGSFPVLIIESLLQIDPEVRKVLPDDFFIGGKFNVDGGKFAKGKKPVFGGGGPFPHVNNQATWQRVYEDLKKKYPTAEK